jgi:hypothetical protein
MGFRLPLPDDLDLSGFRALAFAVRTAPGTETLLLRWYALDDAGKPLFQRPAKLAAAGQWTRIEEPLALWRWAGTQIGEWKRARTLALAVEAPVADLWLDDLRLLPGEGPNAAYPTPDWLVKLAIPDRPTRVLHEDGCLVATDCVAEFTEADLRKPLNHMRRVRQWLRRVFGDAVQPAADHPPTSLLLFRQPGDHEAFFKRLGLAWRVEIEEPGASGYTVQDITGATYSAARGIDRPVYLHEAVHTAGARLLHLRTEVAEHTWLQEGLANYLQLCVYPDSLDWSTYAQHFARPLAPDGRGFFKPLRSLLTQRVEMKHYAQLASLVAYLVAERPAWLPKVASGLAASQPIEGILKTCGADFDALQADWLAWGRKTFVETGAPARFPRPPEWSAP